MPTDLGQGQHLSDAQRAKLRQGFLVVRERQIRCIHVFPRNGMKCDGLARRGAAYCFHHDPSPTAKAKRHLSREHQSTAAKLRHWEQRQTRVRLLDPSASTLGYVPANLGKPRATSRRVMER